LTRQVISSTKLAKELLQEGFKIIDIAPHKNDYKRTIFIFECNNKLLEYLKRKELIHARPNTKQQQNKLYTNTI